MQESKLYTKRRSSEPRGKSRASCWLAVDRRHCVRNAGENRIAGLETCAASSRLAARLIRDCLASSLCFFWAMQLPLIMLREDSDIRAENNEADSNDTNILPDETNYFDGEKRIVIYCLFFMKFFEK